MKTKSLVTCVLALAASTLIATNAFGGTGKVTTDFGSNFDYGNSVALQADGKIVVAGDYWGEFALARYNANGSLDSTFGTGGKVTTGIGSGSGGDGANSVVLQGDGKIVVAGYSNNGTNDDFALVRYNANGSLDTSFNGTGKVTTDFGSGNDYGRGVALQPGGKILVAGYASNGTNNDFALARYNTDGSLDTSFNSTGKVTADFSSGDDYGNSVAVQADGKVIVGGYTNTGAYNDFALVCYNTNGSLDTTFNSTGMMTYFYSRSDRAYSVAVQANGKIVVVGDYSGYGFELMRFNSDGTPDTNGITYFADGNAHARSVAVLGDGKIVVAGYFTSSGGSTSDFALARYNANGSLDTTFNGTGMATTNFGSAFDYGNSVAVQADGKIVVAGDAYTDFGLARYNTDGTLDNSFGIGALPDTRLGLTAGIATGDNVYNQTAIAQTLTVSIPKGGGVRNVNVGIQNDGTLNDAFTVQGTQGNTKFRVQYFMGTADVTASVVAGTFTTGTLAPGAMITLRAWVRAATPLSGQSVNLTITATSTVTPTIKDTACIRARSL